MKSTSNRKRPHKATSKQQAVCFMSWLHGMIKKGHIKQYGLAKME